MLKYGQMILVHQNNIIILSSNNKLYTLPYTFREVYNIALTMFILGNKQYLGKLVASKSVETIVYRYLF